MSRPNRNFAEISIKYQKFFFPQNVVPAFAKATADRRADPEQICFAGADIFYRLAP